MPRIFCRLFDSVTTTALPNAYRYCENVITFTNNKTVECYPVQRCILSMMYVRERSTRISLLVFFDRRVRIFRLAFIPENIRTRSLTR